MSTVSYVVDTGATVVANTPVSFGVGEGSVVPCAPNALPDGIALAGGNAGDSVAVVTGIGDLCKVKVGTGGAAEGMLGEVKVDGLAQSPAAATHQANLRQRSLNIAGSFRQSGAPGDLVFFRFAPLSTFTNL